MNENLAPGGRWPSTNLGCPTGCYCTHLPLPFVVIYLTQKLILNLPSHGSCTKNLPMVVGFESGISHTTVIWPLDHGPSVYTDIAPYNICWLDSMHWFSHVELAEDRAPEDRSQKNATRGLLPRGWLPDKMPLFRFFCPWWPWPLTLT